jgi:hypothetical protein
MQCEDTLSEKLIRLCVLVRGQLYDSGISQQWSMGIWSRRGCSIVALL